LPNSRRSTPRTPRVAAPGARAQHRGDDVLDGLGIERHRGDQRQIAPRVVVAVEEGQLLLPVGRVVGRIEIDRDEPHALAQALAVVGEHRVGQHGAQLIEVGAGHGVLEPRQRRLRAQGRPVERIAVEQQFVNRVVDQPCGIVAVGVAAGQPEDALPQQIPQRVRHLAGLPAVADGAGQAPGQPEPIVDRLQQQGAPVETGVRLVEPGDDRLRNPVDLEHALRYTDCGHRASSPLCMEASQHRLHSTFEGLDGSSLSSFTHNPG
jgi:hypothetical protein